MFCCVVSQFGFGVGSVLGVPWVGMVFWSYWCSSCHVVVYFSASSVGVLGLCFMGGDCGCGGHCCQ